MFINKYVITINISNVTDETGKCLTSDIFSMDYIKNKERKVFFRFLTHLHLFCCSPPAGASLKQKNF